MSLPTPPSDRARQVFLGVLETTVVEERDAYLDRECQGDEELRTAVNSLLAKSDHLEGFLEKPAAVAEPTLRGEKPPSEHIGPYKLLQEIGEGGCGVVYMAEQEQPVRRRVALKVIKLGMDTKSVIARFESERQALAMMDHPNIAKVLEAGATENGRPYFVMELVRGVRITDYCDQHKLSTEDRLQLFIQVAQAIQHAHQKGIIHRDIKPSNILVTLHDGVPVPKIIDFGIAKAVDQRLTDKTLFTEFQSFIGTPAYMSPEQAEMSGLDIDTRSDIYALGVLLYELLVGSTPFDPKTLRDAGLDECRRTIREEEPAKPSLRLSTLLDADRQTIAALRVTEGPLLVSRLKGDLDWIVMRCLDKDRQRRYATANALALDVQRYMDGDLVTARPPSKVYRLQKAWRRHRLALSAAAAVMTALVLGIGASLWQAVRATTAEQESTRLRIDAEHGQQLAVENAAQALRNAERARLNEYVADMNVTNHSLEDGNFGRASQLIEKHRPQAGATDLRGFEWRYLASQSQGDEHFAYPLQGGAIYTLAFSGDGVLLAVGLEREIKVWDVRTRSHIITLSRGARSLAFLGQGHTLVSADGEALSIWHTTTWSEVHQVPSQSSRVVASEDGRLLATSGSRSRRRRSNEGTKVWNTETWQEQIKLPDVSGTLAFSPNGQTLAVRAGGGISLWEVSTGAKLRTLEYSGRDWRSQILSFSPDGKTLVAPRNDNTTRGVYLLGLWDVVSGRELGVLPGDSLQDQHRSTISTVQWSPDGERLFTGSWDHSIHVWDVAEQRNIGSLRGHRNEVWAMAMDPSGATVASGGKDGELLLWPAAISERTDTIDGKWEALAFSQDGTRLAAHDRETNTLSILQTTTLTATQTLELGSVGSRFQRPMAISADLKTLVRRDEEGAIVIVDLVSQESRLITLGDHRPDNLSLSPHGRYLLASSRDHETTCWDLLNSDQPLLSIKAEQARFSDDGTTLVFVPRGRDGSVEVWDVPSMSLRSTLASSEVGWGWALSPDGTLFAASTDHGNAEHAIHLWDTHSGDLLGALRGHKQALRAVAFSSDSKTLASASDDSSLKLWNVTTQQELLSMDWRGPGISCLLFSPDGQWLATSSSAFSSTGLLRLLHAPLSVESSQ